MKTALTIVGVAIVSLTSLVACSKTPSGGSPNAAIIGGQVVSQTDTIARSTALLLMYNPKTHDAFICSSVLVTNDTLLSAAHCFFDEATGRARGAAYVKFVIFKTSFDIQSSESFRDAYTLSESSYVTHPKYSNSTLANDIAVIRLPKALLPGLAPAKILTSMNGVKDVTVAGFGLSSASTAFPRVSVLKFLKTTLGSRRDSNAPLTISVRTSASQRPAIGDSGGPAFATVNGVTYVWGLDSHALDSLDHEYYTPIAPYLDFIKQSARRLR
jgi:hypothetical protein